MGDNLEKLYEKYNTLSEAKDKVSQHSAEYLAAIDSIKGSENEKMLAAQILSKFFKHFPDYQEKALNAMLDLCEDDETKIRACAMRYLVSICRDVKAHVTKVTDILAQMMQLEEQRDYTTASWCLMQLWKEDASNVLKTLFGHVHSLPNAQSREKCIDFIFNKLLKPMENQPPAIEDICIEGAKKILQEEPTCEEILTIIQCMKHTRYAKTAVGQQELIDIMTNLMELDRDFDPSEEGAVDRAIICTKHVLPFFSAKNESTKFVEYYCDQILPQFEKVGKMPKGDLLQLQLLKHLTQLSQRCGKLENPSLHVVQIFDKIKTYMPPPPEDVDVYKMPNFEFSFVECLLYSFHRLARQCPDFLTHDPEVLKDFRARLVYFSRGVQGCNKVLNNKSLRHLDPLNAGKAKVAPTLLNNISMLIKDLFYQPPMYKCNVSLSFKPEFESEAAAPVSTPASATAAAAPSAPQKRHIPITFDNGSSTTTNTTSGPTNPKQSRNSRSGESLKLYAPPSGKFSNNFQNYDRSSGGRGSRPRGRGRGGGGRGFGGGRNWRN